MSVDAISTRRPPHPPGDISLIARDAPVMYVLLMVRILSYNDSSSRVLRSH